MYCVLCSLALLLELNLKISFAFVMTIGFQTGGRRQSWWFNHSWQRYSKRSNSKRMKRMQNKCCWALTVFENTRLVHIVVRAVSTKEKDSHSRSLERKRSFVRCIRQCWVAVSRCKGCGCSMWWRPCTYVTNRAVNATKMNSFILSHIAKCEEEAPWVSLPCTW